MEKVIYRINGRDLFIHIKDGVESSYWQSSLFGLWFANQLSGIVDNSNLTRIIYHNNEMYFYNVN